MEIEQNKKAISKEFAQREMARRHLLPFVQRFMPTYQAGWLHKVFAAKLEKFYRDVQNGACPRLMIFVPPRHGKSQLVSGMFPAWALGQDPTLNIIMASYTISLPQKFSRDNRALLRDRKYSTLFPDTKLSVESTSVDEWYTMDKGGLKCAGVGGGISGFGADIFIIDDPIKDYEDSQSETVRETAKNWYTSTADTRLSPKGGMILVQTRWHDDDLAGARLAMAAELRREGATEEEIEQWEVVSFPAIATCDEYIDAEFSIHHEPGPDRVKVRNDGDALHPQRYPLSMLKRKRAGMPSQQWSALYQQNPVPDSGEFFTKEDFVFYSAEPQLHNYPVLHAWDLAVGKKAVNDYTVGMAGVVIPVRNMNHIYVLDMFRRRVRGKEMIEAMVNMWAKFGSNSSSLGLEYGQIYLSVIDQLKEAFELRNLSPHIDDSLRPVSDKRTRATPARGWMQHHRVFFPDKRLARWTEVAMEELLRFDAGVHDDIVDALAWLVIMAQKMPTVQKYEPRREAGFKSLEQQIHDYMRGQSSGGQGTGYMSS